MTSPASWIGIDWGSTNARAVLFDRGGSVLESVEYPLGIKHVAAGGHRAAFEQMTGEWRKRHGALPAYLSGMIGSRHGWIETAYLPCPVTLAELATRLVPVPQTENVFIVPGVMMPGPRPDVMRGEELQVLGLGRDAAGFDFVCIPGTHSKWIRTDGRVLSEFETAMTGEIFAAIGQHTLFAQLIPKSGTTPGTQAAAFADGLDRSAAAHGLMHALFAIRAAVLMGQIAPPDVSDVLSGLLIGTEIRHVRPRLASRARVALIGTAALNARYATALQAFDIESTSFDSLEIAARGFAALVRR
jgi:2-dehydro-3-deoxygalactonokinase